jgi:phosphoglycolate phosphatase-like HAD superfamily hydrolase
VLTALLGAAEILRGIMRWCRPRRFPAASRARTSCEEAARRLGIAAHECVVVEDSRHGVEAAKRAFMRCIAVPYPTDKPLPDRFAMADLLFEEGMSSFDADLAFR